MTQIVFKRPQALQDVPFHYCPGCHHGLIHRLIAEVIDEMNLNDQTIAIAPVGCSVLAYEYFNLDVLEAAHGRAPAVGTGVKRVHPDKLVFTYQGDGDLAAIGTAEIVHSAARGENISVIFVNNAIYGMTGGQMAPTTLVDQVTNTSPYGRQQELAGFPIKVSEMLATLDGAVYIERVAVNNAANMAKAKAAIKKSFQIQLDRKGFSLVEVLSTCPTNWAMTPLEAVKWLEENMFKKYPLGLIKSPEVAKS